MSDVDRRAAVSRETAETTVDVTPAIDGDDDTAVNTGIGFFDHMLEAFAKHDLLDLAVQYDGDPYTDDRHTIKDMATVLGEALTEAPGNKRGIIRCADRKAPLDETIVSAVVDVSGRPFFEFSGDFSQPHVGEFVSHIAKHFAMSLTINTGFMLHVGIEGDNTHHEVEVLFKTFVCLLDDATHMDPWHSDTPSTKEKL